MDERTRIAIANLTDTVFSIVFTRFSFERLQHFLRCILKDVYNREISFREEYDGNWVISVVKKTIREDDYDCVFTVIEYFVSKICEMTDDEFDTESAFNAVFKSEYVGYRFVNHEIVAITDETEIASINEAVNGPYEFVNFHLSKALSMISDRDNPDYENSIKESISAVEALCEVITGTTGKEATLGNTLKTIEKNGVAIHGALKSAFSALYGYTSDANGIRHAGDIGGPASTFEEAKFMLVSCSAFINYLIGVSAS